MEGDQISRPGQLGLVSPCRTFADRCLRHIEQNLAITYIRAE